MIKYITVLTKSCKNKGYCVAGIDEMTQRLVRLVSEDVNTQGALQNEHILYPSGAQMQIFDKIAVEVTHNQNLWYQPENFVVKSNMYLGYRGKATLPEIRQALMQPEFIFYNTDKSILPQDIQRQMVKSSLQFVEVQTLVLRIDNYDENRIYANFLYNNRWYNYFKITDYELTKKYHANILREGQITLHNAMIVFSLAGMYRDGKHYKLVANIIEQQSHRVPRLAPTPTLIELDWEEEIEL